MKIIKAIFNVIKVIVGGILIGGGIFNINEMFKETSVYEILTYILAILLSIYFGYRLVKSGLKKNGLDK